jgi:hypothetical protein
MPKYIVCTVEVELIPTEVEASSPEDAVARFIEDPGAYDVVDPPTSWGYIAGLWNVLDEQGKPWPVIVDNQMLIENGIAYKEDDDNEC